MKRIRNFPRPDSGNGWQNNLTPRAAAPALSADVAADWLVVGAGYAGLAAARRLAENKPDDHVILVDACEIATGASARNSGFVIDIPHNVGGDDGGITEAQRALRLARSATEWLHDIVKTHQIECQWSPKGQYMAASSPEGAAALEGFTAGLDLIDEPYQRHDANLRGMIGSDYYTSIVHTPGTVLMQPAALVRGLAATLPENVSVYENTPVTSIDYGPPVVAETPNGRISAKGVILCVNGFIQEFGFYQGRVFPIMLFCSMTRQLTEAEHEALGCPEDWGLVPIKAFAAPTIRYTQDRRLTMRSKFTYHRSMASPAGEFRRAVILQAKQIKDRFPELPPDIIEHTWSGAITMSENHAPGFGQQAPNVWTAVCQNGVGVTKGSMSGRCAADMATGRDGPLIADMIALGQPSRLPPRPFIDLGVATMLKRYAWQDRAEA